MKKLIIILTGLVLLLSANVPERSALTTYGEGLFETVPDAVIINLGIQREGLTAEDAQAALRKALANILESLQPLDLANENIKTDSYSLYPVYKQRKNAEGGMYETEEIDRYRTYIRLSIELYQIPQAGKVADTAIKAGVNRVENISFILKDQEHAKNEALKAAIRNAQDKAALLAKQFQVTLSRPLSIQESGSYGPEPRLRNTSLIMAEAKAAGFDLPKGKIQIRSRVDVSYEILPAPAAAEAAEHPAPATANNPAY